MAHIGQWFVKTLMFCVDTNYRRTWRILINRLAKDTMTNILKILTFNSLASFFVYVPSCDENFSLDSNFYLMEGYEGKKESSEPKVLRNEDDIELGLMTSFDPEDYEEMTPEMRARLEIPTREEFNR